MQTLSFKLYDLIVDIAPGMLAIGLAAPLFPAGSLVGGLTDPNSLTFGVWVLFVAYVSGRLIHGTSSYLFDKLPRVKDNDKEMFVVEMKERLQAVNDHDLNRNIRSTLAHRANERYESFEDIPPFVRSVPWIAEENEESDLETLYRIGQAELYGTESLYNKYEMLSTFYRNLTAVFLLYGLLYFGHVAIPFISPWLPTPIVETQYFRIETLSYQSAWASEVDIGKYPVYFFFLVPPLLLILAFGCNRRKQKFDQRKLTAFINDFALHLIDKEQDRS